jgi:hypothetical protein
MKLLYKAAFIILFIVMLVWAGSFLYFKWSVLSKRNHYEWLKREYSDYIWEVVDDIDDVKEIEVKEYDSFLVVYSPQVPQNYLLAYYVPDRDKYPYPKNNQLNSSPFGYWYITISRLYEGGKYFNMEDEALHLALINLQKKLYKNHLAIETIYSTGSCRINLGTIQLPSDYTDFSNADSLTLTYCNRDDSCVKWVELQMRGL